MNYMLIVLFTGLMPTSIVAGPFKNVFACEKAAGQVALLDRRPSNSVCIHLNAKPHHWNGKELPK